MNLFRTMVYFLGAIALVLCIGVIVWYALVYGRMPQLENEGTLVNAMFESLVTV